MEPRAPQTDLYGAPRLTAVEKEGYSRAKVEKTGWLEDRDEDQGAAATERKLPNELSCGICHELLNAAVIFPCCVVAGRQPEPIFTRWSRSRPKSRLQFHT